MRTLIIALGAALAAVPATAVAQSPSAPPSEAEAEAVLEHAVDLVDGSPGQEPSRELTMVLAQLSQAAPVLEGQDRRTANAILARPDDGDGDRYGDGYEVDEAPESPACDPNFCVHWVATSADAPPLADGDGDDIPDYVEETLEAADDSADVENGSLDWVQPVGDGARGGGGANRTDVYLIETDGLYFGYASPDEGQGSISSKEAYLVLDEDMAEFTSAGADRDRGAPGDDGP